MVCVVSCDDDDDDDDVQAALHVTFARLL